MAWPAKRRADAQALADDGNRLTCVTAAPVISTTVRRLLRILAALWIGAAGCTAHGQGLHALTGPWVDDQGRAYDLRQLRGTYTVATMAYGSCRRVSSTRVRVIQQLHRLAEQRHLALKFVIFGLDPREDKPSDLASFRIEQRMQFANVEFLSGSDVATERAAQWMGVRYWRYGEHTMHDFRIVLVSPEGRIVRSVNHFDDDLAPLLP